MKIGVRNVRHMHSNGYRMDPDIHLSEGFAVRQALENLPYNKTSVGECSSNVFYGNIFSRMFVKDKQHGVPYLQASDTTLADLNTGRFLSKIQANELNYLMLKKDWILITCSGTLGNVTYTNSVFENYIATHDLIRVIPNDNKVLKGVLYPFLSSRYGYYQITQSQFGGVVKHINVPQTQSIIVPIFSEEFQREVDALVQESARLREDATDALNEAKKILQEYINLSFKATSGLKTSRRTLKDIRESLQMRLDPPALINESVFTFEQIKDRCKRLGDCDVQVWRPGIFKRVKVSDGYPYIKGSEIFNINPFLRCEYLSKTKTPFVDEQALEEGQILITCAGSVGKVKYITKEFEEKGALGSQDIIRLTSSDKLFTIEYLFVYLQSLLAFDYMQSMKYGHVIERIEPFHVESIPVIIPTQELTSQITEAVKYYKDCLYQAFCKEEKAIQMVEVEIDKWNK